MIRHTIALVALIALSLSTVACAAQNDEAADAAETGSQDVVAQSAKFAVFVGADSQYYFHFVAANGEILLQSEAYTTREAADAGIDAVVQNAPDTRNVEMLESTDSQFYFVVKGNNGEIIATSEMYTTKAGADRGARAVRSLARIIRSGDN